VLEKEVVYPLHDRPVRDGSFENLCLPLLSLRLLSF
jgi:hypothetical protein